ncbi:MAG: DMT family transporter [Candidatus Latescibacteria bacterium]|nr:DMT family transporter [Candidatus Latescibacterota bacterium]
MSRLNLDFIQYSNIITKMSRLKIGLYIGVGLITLSFASILIKLTTAPSIVIAAGRLFIAALILQPIFWSRFRTLKLEIKNSKRGLIILSGVFLAAHFAMWIESLSHTSVPSSVVLVATDPIFVAILSPLLLREKISLKIIIAIILGMIGTAIVASQGFGSFAMTKGNLLALGGAACAGGYLLVGRKVRPKTSLLTYIYIMYTTAAIILASAVFITGNKFTGYSFQSYLFIALLGIGPQLVGHTSFNWALKYVTAPVVAMAILGEPIGTSILSWLILKQPPTIIEIIGGVIICIGIYLAASSIERKQPQID